MTLVDVCAFFRIHFIIRSHVSIKEAEFFHQIKTLTDMDFSEVSQAFTDIADGFNDNPFVTRWMKRVPSKTFLLAFSKRRTLLAEKTLEDLREAAWGLVSLFVRKTPDEKALVMWDINLYPSSLEVLTKFVTNSQDPLDAQYVFDKIWNEEQWEEARMSGQF
jgi:hypothetical protein